MTRLQRRKQLRIEQDIVMDAGSREVSGDKRENGEVEGAEQEVQQMENDEMDVTVDDQRRRRSKGKQTVQQTSLKLRMKYRVTSMRQRSCRINEQGPDGEEMSREEQQHQAVIESGNMVAKQQKERASSQK